MAANPEMIEGLRIRRDRPRVESFAKLDKQKIVQRVVEFYKDDNQNRTDEIDARLQRYAKYRMWTEPKDWPWEDATNFANPDMMLGGVQ